MSIQQPKAAADPFKGIQQKKVYFHLYVIYPEEFVQNRPCIYKPSTKVHLQKTNHQCDTRSHKLSHSNLFLITHLPQNKYRVMHHNFAVKDFHHNQQERSNQSVCSNLETSPTFSRTEKAPLLTAKCFMII